jgi:hypothetical protein
MMRRPGITDVRQVREEFDNLHAVLKKRASCILKEENTMDIWTLIAEALVSLVAIATALC